ncbi:Benzaldehyde dehydrogenase (NAD(+)) [Bienertia sinuspersici]
MDESEFQRLLLLFPVVRTRDYRQADSGSSGQSTSQAENSEVAKEWQDAWGEQETKTQDVFWDKLRSAAEKKAGSVEAERFCNAFQKIYHKLVHEELSREVIESFLYSS